MARFFNWIQKQDWTEERPYDPRVIYVGGVFHWLRQS